MAQQTHDCDELAIVARKIAYAIDADGGLRKGNQYRTGELRELPLFQTFQSVLASEHASFRYREQLEDVARKAAYVILDIPRAGLPELARERLRELENALEIAEPNWRESPLFHRD